MKLGNISRATGRPLPRGVALPKMRSRKKFVAKDMVELLYEALENLSNADCTFWACRGPNYTNTRGG